MKVQKATVEETMLRSQRLSAFYLWILVKELEKLLRRKYPRFTHWLPRLDVTPTQIHKGIDMSDVDQMKIGKFSEEVYCMVNKLLQKKKLPKEKAFAESLRTVAADASWCFWWVVSSVEELRSEHPAIETFAKFLEESYTADDLFFYITLCKKIQMVIKRSRQTPQAGLQMA